MLTICRLLAIVLIGTVVSAAMPVAHSDGRAISGTARHVPAPAVRAALDRAEALEKRKKMDQALAAGYEAIEADPNYLAAHDWLTGFADRRISEVFEEYSDPGQQMAHFKQIESSLKTTEKAIDTKYEEWLKRFPNSPGVLYGMGTNLSHHESPKARAYLLKYVKQDPNNADVYGMLATDALMAGDRRAASEYYHKRMALEPNNPKYAFDYAWSLDPSERKAAFANIVKQFPHSESAADALSSLSEEAQDDTQRIRYLEELRTQYPPGKSEGRDYDMRTLFEIYLRTDPQKAFELARDMVAGKAKDWGSRVELAQAFIQVKQMLAAGRAREAVALLGKLKLEKYSEDATMIERVKARVVAGAGRPQAAYRALLQVQAKSPEDETEGTLEVIGKQLHKSSTKVRADIKAAVYAHARRAPPFDLETYGSNRMVSLAKLRGKVVLLTFWFPGCSVCREEFPYFETAMRHVRKESSEVVYIGINAVREQDSYVLPRMKRSQYSFIPLKGNEGVLGTKKGYAVVGEPTNFIIDRSGKIVYSGFLIENNQSEVVLQRMLESVL